MKLSGWGRYPIVDAPGWTPRSEASVAELLQKGKVIARGNGRSYGDSAVSIHGTLDMRRFNRMLSFDPQTGQLVAEAGVLLRDIIACFLPQCWFPAVTPGTKFVTLGGMIAADVHGKNHHRDGSMVKTVDWLDVMGPDGQVHRCGPDKKSDLFAWTVGGMGLTGIILRAAIRLQPVETGWIRQETQAVQDLDAVLRVFEKSDDAAYSVAWIDCLARGKNLGRSLVMLGEHARLADLTPKQQQDRFALKHRQVFRVPVDVPPGILNRYSARLFNHLYFWWGSRKAGHSLIDWDRYFYPLDALLDWNRIYGRRGFMQFQCVLPLETARPGLRALLTETSSMGAGSFLAVLKRLGAQSGPFSFPMTGYTLALDFPVSPANTALMERLDKITIDHGGRFYLAKDARMRAETLAQSDARAALFKEMRRDTGLANAFSSAQSERLTL